MYFTICIPSFNRADKIIRTLNSLEKQTFTDFEILVIDDGSTDNTKEIIKRYRNKSLLKIKYIYKANGGKHTAINTGISYAMGIFFMILDSDDCLIPYGLETLYELCREIEHNNLYSGILARCMNIDTKKLIGKELPKDVKEMSYIDIHFRLGMKSYDLGDCCECNKTKILKNYMFPIDSDVKFIPEAWLFDQIGIKYKLLCSNAIVKEVEYLSNGITNDVKFKYKNNVGFLYHYTSRIERILPYINSSIIIKIIAWWRYWESVKFDHGNKGPRVKKTTFLGWIVKWASPMINLIFKIKYREIYKSGR